jgi:hypothetical protein
VRLSRLTTKLFLATALVTLLALGTLAALAVAMSQARLRERIAAHNRTTAGLAARAVERYVTHATDIVREATSRPKLNAEISSANWTEASRVLDNLLRHFTLFDAVSLLDSGGVLRARVPGWHTQSEYQGTGVGLGIVRKVAERHGGRAWAVSEPARGSTFSLSLPVNGRVAG